MAKSDTVQRAARGLSDGSTLSGGSVGLVGQPGRPDGGPRGAAVLKAVQAYLTGKAARPGRARLRGGRGVRGVRVGPQTVKSAPDSAPPEPRLPGFTGDFVGCSSPVGTTQPIRGQDGAGQRDKDAGRLRQAAATRRASAAGQRGQGGALPPTPPRRDSRYRVSEK